ncbi:MAG: AAA family ATPase [Pseudomonadota bacterium]
MPDHEPTFWLIAGPNGVGKTTYAFKHVKALTGSINFVNMDEIARGLSPLDPSAVERDAARLALSRARKMIADQHTFAMETTMSRQTHRALLKAASANGMKTSLMYFSVQSPDICRARVARRVAEGGHDVPSDVIERRFGRSHANLPAYAAQCSLWRVYEASAMTPCLALEGKAGALHFADAHCLTHANEAVRQFRATFA